MVLTAPRRWRWVAAIAVGVGALSLTTLPAEAAPSTKNYTAGVALPGGGLGSATSSLLVTNPSAIPDAVLWLTNEKDSNQNFGSVKISLSNSALVLNSVSVPNSGTDWTVTQVTGGWLLTSAVGVSVAPAASLEVDLSVSGVGTASVVTSVKQSNDFNGGNNSFTLHGGDPQLTLVQSCDSTTTTTSTGYSCTPTATSSASKISASGSLSSTSQFGYIFNFSDPKAPQLLASCTDEAFGASASPEPLVVQTFSSGAGVAKTITLTFPRKLVNLAPNNGTPFLDVCAGADAAFPAYGGTGGTGWTGGTGYYPFQGLLYDCTDQAYVDALNATTFLSDGTRVPTYPLHMCVADRYKIAGGAETVVINVESSTLDPSYW